LRERLTAREIQRELEAAVIRREKESFFSTFCVLMGLRRGSSLGVCWLCDGGKEGFCNLKKGRELLFWERNRNQR
jgi:hypothetical protein